MTDSLENFAQNTPNLQKHPKENFFKNSKIRAKFFYFWKNFE